MKSIRISILLFALLMVGASLYAGGKSDKNPIRCRIVGEVTGRPDCNELLLVKAEGDFRMCEVKIPVNNGKFEYELTNAEPLAYELACSDEYQSGVMNPVLFFCEPGEVNIHITESRFKGDAGQVKGGKLNDQLADFYRLQSLQMTGFDTLKQQMAELGRQRQAYQKQWLAFGKQMEAAPQAGELDVLKRKRQELAETTGEALKVKEAAARDAMNQMQQDYLQWRHRYYEENPSLVAYYLLYNEVKRNKGGAGSAELADIYYTSFQEKYPNHFYTQRIDEVFAAIQMLKVGEPYTDFMAPGLDGKQVKLSEQIAGKIALIDLWASWCGSCRENSMRMIPVYNAYKDRGFTVVGVARERKNTKAMEEAIQKDQYPWTNLVELDDAGRIWGRYGADNRGGRTILVGRDGKIIAIDPTVEEVETILKNLTLRK